MSKHRRIMVAVSGASGAVYAKRLLEVLPSVYDRIYLTISENAAQIIPQELGVSNPQDIIAGQDSERFSVLESDDLSAPPASGSHDYDGVVVVPCSMGVVGRIASGVSNDLVTRAADVCLKERRKVILVARETPLSLIHLRNLTVVTEAGAVVLPPAPAFYNAPQSIDDLVDFVVDRILRALGLDARLLKGWGE